MSHADAAMVWRKTNAPIASSRTDDIWFASADIGWAVNSNGQILKTSDGGRNWVEQLSDDTVYLRCVGFSGTQIGWVGSISAARRLFATRDGGATWKVVENLPPKPTKICGISVVDDQVVYASGTNDPRDDPAVLKTTDGGATWTSIDMRAQASLLVDIHFETRDRGWVVGGRDAVPCPGRRATREVVWPVVLFTEDGGATWKDLLPAKREFPLGEWGWKIFFLNDRVAFVSLENFLDGAILKSVDGGKTWQRVRINDRQRNADLEGVGFLSEDVGWVGGWGDANFEGGFTSATTDGGRNWDNANEVGFRLNRFRFLGNPVTVGYASGDTVYKLSAEPVAAVNEVAARSLLREDRAAGAVAATAPRIDVPDGAGKLSVGLWDRFGNYLELTSQDAPPAGEQSIRLDPEAVAAAGLQGSAGILRVTIDGRSESRLIPLAR